MTDDIHHDSIHFFLSTKSVFSQWLSGKEASGLEIILYGLLETQRKHERVHWSQYNSLPHNKISDQSKLKTFADYNIYVTESLKFVLGRVKNIVGKGENAGYQHFLLFSPYFKKASYTGSLKVVIVR